jgi:hypothetical protein
MPSRPSIPRARVAVPVMAPGERVVRVRSRGTASQRPGTLTPRGRASAAPVRNSKTFSGSPPHLRRPRNLGVRAPSSTCRLGRIERSRRCSGCSGREVASAWPISRSRVSCLQRSLTIRAPGPGECREPWRSVSSPRSSKEPGSRTCGSADTGHSDRGCGPDAALHLGSHRGHATDNLRRGSRSRCHRCDHQGFEAQRGWGGVMT